MPKRKRIHLMIETAAMPSAYIYATDTSVALNVRDIIDSRMMRVFLNAKIVSIPTYIIIIGIPEFVKSIHDSLPIHNKTKCLCITWGDGNKNFVLCNNSFVAKVDSYLITKKIIKNILNDFMQGEMGVKEFKVLSSYKPKSLQHTSLLLLTQKRQSLLSFKIRPLGEEDKKRIKNIFNKIYPIKRKLSFSHLHLTKAQLFPLRRKILAVSFLTLVLTPIIWFGTVVSVSGLLLYISIQLLFSGQDTYAVKTMDVSSMWISHGEKVIDASSNLLDYIEKSSILDRPRQAIRTIRRFETAGRQGMTLLLEGKTISSDIIKTSMDSKKGIQVSTLINMRTTLSEFSGSLGLVDLDLSYFEHTYPYFAKIVGIPAFREKLMELRSRNSDFQFVDRLLLIITNIVSTPGPKRYLFLFQNSSELRPTGGFIGSVGVLTLHDGEYVAFDIQDVYALDGQLKGHVDPPIPIRTILSQEHWYLRDSNWDPNFSESARRAAWFYEKETGVIVDGVIGISSTLLERILNITGPIQLIGINDTISKDTLYSQANKYTQGNFFPGSLQKDTFLTALYEGVRSALVRPGLLTSDKLFSTIQDSFEGKDIQLYFSDPEVEEIVQGSNLSGDQKIIDPCVFQTQKIPCSGVAVGIIESNLGVNKVNAYLIRNMVHTISLGLQSSFDHEFVITLANPSNQSQGGGAYVTYQEGLFSSNIFSHMLEINKNYPIFYQYIKDEIKPTFPFQEKENSVNTSIIYPYGLVINPGTSAEIIHNFQTQKTISNQPFQYGITIGKQAGIMSVPYTLRFVLPVKWTAKMISGVPWSSTGMVESNQVFQYNTMLSRDTTIFIDIHPAGT
jgi:hypothetical protein